MMMETLRAPVDSKSVLFFDYSNLVKFLDFIEMSNCQAHEDIYKLQVRIRSLDEVETNIKDLFQKVEGINERLEEVNKSIGHHGQKIMDLEVKSRSHLDVRI